MRGFDVEAARVAARGRGMNSGTGPGTTGVHHMSDERGLVYRWKRGCQAVADYDALGVCPGDVPWQHSTPRGFHICTMTDGGIDVGPPSILDSHHPAARHPAPTHMDYVLTFDL